MNFLRNYNLNHKNAHHDQFVSYPIKYLIPCISKGEGTPLKLPLGVAGIKYTALDGRHLIISHQNSIHRLRYLLYDFDNHAYEEIIPVEYGEFNLDRDLWRKLWQLHNLYGSNQVPRSWENCIYNGRDSSLKKIVEETRETFPVLSFYFETQMGKPVNEDTLAL